MRASRPQGSITRVAFPQRESARTERFSISGDAVRFVKTQFVRRETRTVGRPSEMGTTYGGNVLEDMAAEGISFWRIVNN
jgi:hypothetical protein